MGAYVGSVRSPPPPNPTAIAISALVLGLTVPWAYWIDRNWVVRPHKPVVAGVP